MIAGQPVNYARPVSSCIYNPLDHILSMSNTLHIMKTQLKMLYQCYRMVHFNTMLYVYLVVYFVLSLIIWYFDSDIKDLSDALWFTFQTATTIGYGDLLANSVIGRILAVILSIYSIALVAVFTGILAGFYVELIKAKTKDSVKLFLFDLQRLPDMSREELVELSERARKLADEE